MAQDITSWNKYNDINMKKLKIILILTFFLFLFLFKTNISAKEPAHVLIINQIRGEECCSKGSFINLQKQIENHIAKKVPAYFALRFDALINEDYVSYVKEASIKYPELIKLSVLIENTPQLINKVGINKNIKEENWFEAQNAFTIGYSQNDAKKIVDFLFLIFYEKFGYYPSLTSSWMIDTKTLNYLHDYYQVNVHQITREQYGTDSYTLYGGPPHYPYPASRNWLFIPDYINSDPVLIVRQTVADPLLNYGDSTNTFTSQPNDYLRGKKNFDYFVSLIDQAINQPGNQIGFVMLGLENSMDNNYQEEYIAQLERIGKLESKGLIKLISLDELTDYWQENKISIYYGKNLLGKNENQAFWITTSSYRIRLIEKNNQILITDFRLYNKSFSDPYTNYIAEKNGFWIVPYLIDGSLKYIKTTNHQTAFEKLFNKPIVNNEFFELKNDLVNTPDAIILPNIFDKKSTRIEKFNDKLELSYNKNTKEKVTIVFYEEKIIIKPINQNEIFYQSAGINLSPIKLSQKNGSNFKLEWKIDSETAFSLLNKCVSGTCEISFETKPTLLDEIRTKQYPFIFPEPINRKINQEKSFFYPHNQYAVAGRNPIRLFFSARDNYNLPTIISENIHVLTSSPITKTEIVKNSANLFIQYIDLYNDQPKKYSATIKINKDLEIKLKEPVYFAPNCKKEITYCFTHPIQAYWYLKSFIADKTRR
jgi:hypothetical protein